MDILLLTMLPNEVAGGLDKLSTLQLTVIDCKDKDFHEKIEDYVNFHFNFVLISYRCPYIIPKIIYLRATNGAFNIHPSLLPKYPGLNPWDDMFVAKEHEGGVTVHKLSEKVDCGEIMMQESFEITDGDTIETARQKADRIASRLIVSLITNLKRI